MTTIMQFASNAKKTEIFIFDLKFRCPSCTTWRKHVLKTRSCLRMCTKGRKWGRSVRSSPPERSPFRIWSCLFMSVTRRRKNGPLTGSPVDSKVRIIFIKNWHVFWSEELLKGNIEFWGHICLGKYYRLIFHNYVFSKEYIRLSGALIFLNYN